MEAIQTQRDIVQSLLKRLKAYALELAAFHMAMDNFMDEDRAQVMKMVEVYRNSTSIQEKVERGFHNLDLLIQLVEDVATQEDVRKLLEQFDPTGLPN